MVQAVAAPTVVERDDHAGHRVEENPEHHHHEPHHQGDRAHGVALGAQIELLVQRRAARKVVAVVPELALEDLADGGDGLDFVVELVVVVREPRDDDREAPVGREDVADVELVGERAPSYRGQRRRVDRLLDELADFERVVATVDRLDVGEAEDFLDVRRLLDGARGAIDLCEHFRREDVVGFDAGHDDLVAGERVEEAAVCDQRGIVVDEPDLDRVVEARFRKHADGERRDRREDDEDRLAVTEADPRPAVYQAFDQSRVPRNAAERRPRGCHSGRATASPTVRRCRVLRARMLTRVDHLVVAVEDLERATETYGRLLGLLPSWRGVHPDAGSANTLFRLSNTYVELLAPDGDAPFADFLRDHLEAHGEGPLAIAFGTDDASAAHATLRARGISAPDPDSGSGLEQTTSAVCGNGRASCCRRRRRAAYRSSSSST